MAQDTTSCDALVNDVNGDLQVGATDILQILGTYGQDFDVDGDGVPDCEDPCVGQIDECGVCNGSGPQLLIVDSIIALFDSVYVEDIADWVVYELTSDTVFVLVCDTIGCSDPEADNYNPYATSEGACDYGEFNCGEPWSFDGHNYPTVAIGNQCWFAENLQTSVYSDGSLIPEVTSWNGWSTLEVAARCDYDNDVTNVPAYGRLYNWMAVGDERGLCPSGWHVPMKEEWTDLQDYVADAGFLDDVAVALKATSGWSISANGTDDFGFAAIPAGYRWLDGSFDGVGTSCFWWTSSNFGSESYYANIMPYGSYIQIGGNEIEWGHSVRCVQDVLGCTDSGYFEFHPLANTDDGSCATLIIEGCSEPEFLEYEADVNLDDGSCQTVVVPGCTDPAFEEYNAEANSDDGSCSTYYPACESPSMDGYVYSVALKGQQCWFAENLRTTVYSDGSEIPEVIESWYGLDTGARVAYDDDESNVQMYGWLYNKFAVLDDRGLCPSGWHVPTDEEWMTLELELGMGFTDRTSTGWRGTDEGDQLKATTGWSGGGNGTDVFGFSALPGGIRNSLASYSDSGSQGSWWSASLGSFGSLWFRSLSEEPTVYRANSSANIGISIRCLRDANVWGCTNPDYLEFDPLVNVDDGSCATLVVPGCIDDRFVNYDPTANMNDGSCGDLVGCEEGDAVIYQSHSYDVVTIGAQCWFAQNLRSENYLNGDSIPSGLSTGEWSIQIDGASAVYGDGISDCESNSPDVDACDEVQSLAEYGRLYNAYAVVDARGLCPQGWHVPTDAEWTVLEDYTTIQGFAGNEGEALKSTTGWSGDGHGTDNFGFSALPGGLLLSNSYSSGFQTAGDNGYWWSSSLTGGYSYYRRLNHDASEIWRASTSAQFGFSVRCLRDDQ